MTRLSIVLALVWSFTGSARADDHEDWLKFFEGNWGYVEEQGDESGQGVITGKLVSNGKVLVAEFVDAGGPSIEIIGWRPDAGRLVSNGYGSAGTYYQHDFTTITKDTLKGATHGVTADGIGYKGSIVIERKSPDQFEWRIDAKTAKGDAFKAGGTTTRKPAANQAVQSWLKYFEGNWKYEETIDGESDSGTAAYTLEGTEAMIARFKGGSGSATELLGWRADDQKLSAAGHGLSNASYWRHELTVTPEFAVGPTCGVLADGRKYDGTITIKQLDADHWEWRIQSKTDDNQDVVGAGKFTRQ